MKASRIMAWAGLIIIGLALFTVTVGWYPRYFDVQWHEEVQLRDGSVVVVRITDRYERRHLALYRYASAIHRDTELAVDTPTGTVRQMFKGGRPLLLERAGQGWLLVFDWNAEWSPALLQGQDWGPERNPNGQSIARSQGTRFVPASFCDLPGGIRTPNLLIRTMPVEVLAELDGRRITLQEKATLQAKYPPGYAHVRVERPQTSDGHCRADIK